jgi:hypothetical protein
MSIKRLYLRLDEYEGLKEVSKCEKAIRRRIEELSEGKLTLTPMGYLTESDEIVNAPIEEKIEHLDYEVTCDNKPIAIVEVSCTNYTFEGSKFFPINAYKLKRPKSLPIFFVYSLEKEPCELAERCWWISEEKAMLNLLRSDPVWLKTMRPGGIKNQLNYLTERNAWTRELQSFVKELLKIEKPKSKSSQVQL